MNIRGVERASDILASCHVDIHVLVLIQLFDRNTQPYALFSVILRGV